MSFAAGRAYLGASPIGGAIQTRRPAPPPPPRPATLAARLDGKLAEIEGAGYAVRWLEIGRDELLALFRELGEEAVRLDPDPAKDCGWYRDYEVRYSGRELVWIFLEGEVPGEISAHVID
jgi:hypothetical protein